MRNLKTAFTLVELIVVITILAILGTIGYFSLSGYQVTARDSARVSDVGLITNAIKLNKVGQGSYPSITNPQNVTFTGAVIWKQGSFGEVSHQETRRLSKIPTDPLTGNEYAYSTTTTTGEYQVGAIFEHTQQAYIPGIDTSYAANLPEVMSNHIKGNYNGKFITYVENPNETLKNIYVLGVPSILTSETGPVTLQQIYTNKSFVYKNTRNAPGSYSGRVVAKEGIQFAATTITPVIYEGTNATLSNTAGKVALIKNLQTHYKDSSILNNDSFAEIRTLDLTLESDTNRAVALVNTFLTTGQGGLDGERTGVSTSTVATTGGSGGSTGETLTTNPKAAAECYTAAVNTIGSWEGCNGMLIVDRDMLYEDRVSTNGQSDSYGEDFYIDYNGTQYTFGNSDHNIFTGQVTDMSKILDHASNFNADIGYWDVSNATNMSTMFRSAYDFNTDIGNWDVSNVIRMGAMFQNAYDFNVDIGNWDVSNVKNMSTVFNHAYDFNQDISKWDVSNVTGGFSMFAHARAFNQDISGWDTGSFINMTTMFSGAKAFNQDLSSWNTDLVASCANFDSSTSLSWFLPKPSFTNCNPD